MPVPVVIPPFCKGVHALATDPIHESVGTPPQYAPGRLVPHHGARHAVTILDLELHRVGPHMRAAYDVFLSHSVAV